MTEWKVMEQFQDVVSHLKDVVIILESDRVTVSISECHALKLLFKRWNWKFTSHFLLIYSDYVANIIHASTVGAVTVQPTLPLSNKSSCAIYS